MPEVLYEVTCKCGRSLVTTDRIRDPEIAILEEHLRACSRLAPLREAPMLGDIMSRVRVAATSRA